MQESDHSQNDPLEEMLGGGVCRLANGDALRGALLAQTIGVIRGRRWLKRCALAASLVGCYLAGITTVGFWRSEGIAALGASRTLVASADKPSETAPPSPSSAAPTGADTPQVPARVPTAFESWRNIGDYYLQQSNDIALALDSYSQAISLATEKERAIAPGQDTWLLMALKDSHEKEQSHAYYEPN